LRELVPEARNMAVSVMTEREIQAAGAPLPRSVNGGAILSAVDNYVSTIAPYISQIIKDADPEFQEGVNNFIDTSKKDGWFMLGSYYWTIARITEHTHELAGNLPTTTEANYARLMTNMWEDPAFAALWKTSENASEKALAERRDAAKVGTEGVWAKVVEFVKQNLFPDALSPVKIYTDRLKNENALMTLTDMGHSLVGASESLGIAAIGAGAAAAAAEEGSKNIVLNTLTLGASSAAGGAASFLSKAALVIVSIIISALFSAGVLLAFYLPALPWILWMSALIGWLILIVETLFAAPLWAVGHLIPEGDGFAGQHGRQGYMLLLGVLARPPLMVVGFFTSLIIFSVFGNFVGYCFSIFHSSVTAGHAVGVVSTIVQIIILTSAILVFSHKIFSLMNILPERVCNWVGQLNQNLGEESDPAQVRGAVVAGGGVISKGGGAAAPAPQRGGGGPEPEQLKPSNTGGRGKVQNGDLSQ
jgi:conjugal transfer/type IV secretion protein DotA/TraY